MKSRDIALLQQMGITYWQVRRPDFYPERAVATIDLPAGCRLLFVNDDTLTEQDAWLFGRILHSMKLSPDQALTLPSHCIDNIGEHHLQWCWFAGCDGREPMGTQRLQSCSLAHMHDHPLTKKALWQQICSYD